MQKLTKAEFMAKVMNDRRRKYREQMEEKQIYKEDEIENYMARKFSKYGKYNRYFV